MARKAEDHSVYDSQQTLARAFGVDVKTIVRSQKRLASPALNWINRPQRRGKSNLLSINHENVPGEEHVRLQITPDAKSLAVRYQVALDMKLGRKKFPKGWLQQQFLSAQRILNDCAGNVEVAAAIVGHALSHPLHKKRSSQSLYHLYGRWKKVLVTYQAVLQAENARATAKIQASTPVQDVEVGVKEAE